MSSASTSSLHSSRFRDLSRSLFPKDGSFDSCLTCGMCSSACPASGLEDMDPRKFVRMANLGMDHELCTTPWVWMCTMCRRCVHVCPMQIDIPALVYEARASWPKESRPKGIMGSCAQALRTEGNSAMGASSEDFSFVVNDVLEEVHDTQEGQEKLVAPIDKKGAKFFLNQNSREPVMEPDEMVPLWKILDYVGADWTYGSVGWAAENYCMFAADDAAWEKIVRDKVSAVEELGCQIWLNTE